jgi:hypothetical protein
LTAALPAPRATVCVGPPLLASGCRFRFAPYRLFALAADAVKPSVSPMALKDALMVINGTAAMSSRPLAEALFETIVLTRLMVAATDVGAAARPPPPSPVVVEVVVDTLPVIVLF